MAFIDSDGSVHPSHQNPKSIRGKTSGANQSVFQNYALRMGYVVGAHSPDGKGQDGQDDPDGKKQSDRKFYVYDVICQQVDAYGAEVEVLYRRCRQMESLGNSADRSSYTLRAASEFTGHISQKVLDTATKVVLLCGNGRSSSPVILGCLQHGGGVAQKEEDGHNFAFEFNGVQQTINKDGELQIRYRGATKIDGTLDDNANADAEGSTLIFNKDGDIKVYTKDEKQFIHLNHKDKKLEILADEEWNVKVNKKLIFEAGDDISITGKKACSIEITDNITMKSSGVLVGDATDAWLLADTYRKAEAQMLKKISTALQTIMGLITTAGASLTAAAAANAPPIVGGAIAATPFAAAATALTQAGPKFMEASAAIEAFEAQASTYLSKKNKND